MWRYFDIWLVAAVLLLTAYGILIIRSAVTGAPAFEALPSDQVRWAIIGIVIMMVVASVDYRVLTSAHWYIYAGLILTLALVLVAGAIGNETRRWIEISWGGYSGSACGIRPYFASCHDGPVFGRPCQTDGKILQYDCFAHLRGGTHCPHFC